MQFAPAFAHKGQGRGKRQPHDDGGNGEGRRDPGEAHEDWNELSDGAKPAQRSGFDSAFGLTNARHEKG